MRKAETWRTGSALLAIWSALLKLKTVSERCSRWPPGRPCRSASVRRGAAVCSYERSDMCTIRVQPTAATGVTVTKPTSSPYCILHFMHAPERLTNQPTCVPKLSLCTRSHVLLSPFLLSLYPPVCLCV